jgi:hypothetical protein
MQSKQIAIDYVRAFELLLGEIDPNGIARTAQYLRNAGDRRRPLRTGSMI